VVVARPLSRPVYGAGIAAACCWAVVTVLLWDRSLAPGTEFLVAEVRKLTLAVAVAGLITGLDVYVRRLPALIASFGRSGYSLYAFHAPILIAAVAFGWPWWIALVAAVTVAVLAYRFYERPLLLRGRRIAATRFGSSPGSRPQAPVGATSVETVP
jgi:peptidoglycan/LPS O-acetylase OafA/YrhL